VEGERNTCSHADVVSASQDAAVHPRSQKLVAQAEGTGPGTRGMEGIEGIETSWRILPGEGRSWRSAPVLLYWGSMGVSGAYELRRYAVAVGKSWSSLFRVPLAWYWW